MAENPFQDLFDEIEASQEKLFNDFAQSEATIIEGVVAPSGLSAGTGGETCHLTFGTSPWRQQGGELIHEEATVRKRCSNAEVDEIMGTPSACTVFQIEGKLLTSPEGWGSPQIELLRIIKADLNDPDLNQAVEDLKKPAIHQDVQFGAFTLDRRVNWYNAQATWMGSTTRLSLV